MSLGRRLSNGYLGRARTGRRMHSIDRGYQGSERRLTRHGPKVASLSGRRWWR